MNVSGGTAVMRDKEGYRGIPKAYIQGWGQGLALSFFFATLLISDDIEKDGRCVIDVSQEFPVRKVGWRNGQSDRMGSEDPISFLAKVTVL